MSQPLNHQQEFEKAFEALRAMGEQTFVLRGSTMIVWELPEEELKTSGGLIIATDSRQVMGNSVEQGRLKVAKVLMTGPGYYQDDGTYLPLDIKPGAVVILPQYSTSPISVFPGIVRPTSNKLTMVKEDSVLAYYPSQEAYESAKRELN